jgi:hypothetical protein
MLPFPHLGIDGGGSYPNIFRRLNMKGFLIAMALATTTIIATPALAAIGASISIGEPGFYGQLDIGNFPQPQVIYRQPIIIEPVLMDRPPIYLHVPPGHAKHWRRHCGEYNACGERVFFVQDGWYNREYVPRYQGEHQDEGRDEGRDEGGDNHGGGHGNGKGNGHGHGRGRD